MLDAQRLAVLAEVAYETRDYQVTLALIEAGLGISLVPASVLRHVSHRGITIREPYGTAPAREIYLVHHRRSAALVADMISMIAPPPA